MAQNTPTAKPYIGRFAPSPTGRLHAGSLLAAVASYLDAKAHQGKWLLRIEDLDPPREEAGADLAIIETLKAHSLFWDDEICWQSKRLALYQAALEQLISSNKAFACSCSRQDLQLTGGKHQGDCRNQSDEIAWRFLVNNQNTSFDDAIFGMQSENVFEIEGDFVIRRKDHLFAYQLAVVVDDYLQGITHIVRGSDLLDSTFKQIELQKALNYITPHYCHIPVLVDHLGAKLSKQTHAPIIENSHAEKNLIAALEKLKQELPPTNKRNNCEEILQWAVTHWQPTNIPKTQQIDV